MSKALKTVIAVGAAIAIPFAAPAIASTIGLSTAIGTALGSATAGSVIGGAITGAALNAATAAATGGNARQAALMGAISGGIGGYTAAPSTAPVSTGQGAFLGEGVPSGVAQWDTAAQTAGLALPSTPTLAMTPTMTQGAFLGENVATGVPQYDLAAQQAGLTLTSPASLSAPVTTVAGASGLPSTGTAMTATGPTTATATAPTAAGAPKTFTEALKQVPGAIAAKFTDPNALADMTLRAAGVIAGSALAGQGISPEERQLLDSQVEELRQLRQTNQNLFNQKLEQAQNLIGESRYFDPEYFGLQRARRAQLAGARAKQAGLRGLSGERARAEARRFDIATGRETGTQFDVGYQSGIQGRLGTIQAGLNAMPGYMQPTSGYSDIRRAFEAAEDRRNERAKNIGDLFGSLTGIGQSRSVGRPTVPGRPGP